MAGGPGHLGAGTPAWPVGAPHLCCAAHTRHPAGVTGSIDGFFSWDGNQVLH